MSAVAPVVQAEHVSKRFGAQWALQDVSLEVLQGEIHGLLGQNGCGKSTLIKVLAGFHAPDEGRVLVGGAALSSPVSTRELRAHRLRFVHQDLALVGSLSVADNFNLDSLATRHSLARVGAQGGVRETQEVLDRWGVRVPASAPIDTLSRLDRARVAIVKAVRDFDDGGGGLLVLDEPTAFLPADEARSLFAAMHRVADGGAGVLFVSHNLDEIRAHTDRVTVLRDGRLVGVARTRETSVDEVVELILGRGRDAAETRSVLPMAGAPIARVDGLEAPGLASFSLDVHPGEVIGLTGLIGSGFERVPRLLFGLEPASAGTVVLDGRPVPLAGLDPGRALRAGIGSVPSERLTEATAPTLTVEENVNVLTLRQVARHLLTRSRALRRARALTRPVDVRPDDPTLPLLALSGGNQQKVVLAKWLSIAPRLLLIAEPTQGVDIGARAQIAAILRQRAREGCAVLCSSSDLDQLTELCDRVLVFRAGHVVAEVAGEQVSKYALMQALFGDAPDAPRAEAP